MRTARTKPTTPAGRGRRDIAGADWQLAAFKTAASALARMEASQ